MDETRVRPKAAKQFTVNVDPEKIEAIVLHDRALLPKFSGLMGQPLNAVFADHYRDVYTVSAESVETPVHINLPDLKLPYLEAGTVAGKYTRYQQLVKRVNDVFGDEIAAAVWLSTSSPDFGGYPPIQVALKEGYSLAKLEPILTRIEHGIDF